MTAVRALLYNVAAAVGGHDFEWVLMLVDAAGDVHHLATVGVDGPVFERESLESALTAKGYAVAGDWETSSVGPGYVVPVKPIAGWDCPAWCTANHVAEVGPLSSNPAVSMVLHSHDVGSCAGTSPNGGVVDIGVSIVREDLVSEGVSYVGLTGVELTGADAALLSVPQFAGLKLLLDQAQLTQLNILAAAR